MAEISTIARPYAEALLKAVRDNKDPALADKLLASLKVLDGVVADPQVREVANDPVLTENQVYDLIYGLLGKGVPEEIQNLLKLVIENGRLEAIPQISSQFHQLLNQERKEAEVLIETPFPLNDKQLADLVKALARKFPGLKLLPKVILDKSLIGGVRVSVGDKVLDGTVKARLDEMQVALTS